VAHRAPARQPTLPDLSGLDPHQLRDYFADTHYATPLRALALLDRLGHLPRHMAVIGCEPEQHEAMHPGLSAPVAAALERAEAMAMDWISHHCGTP
jgi:hydrogenase maturation protease